jgi:hypothetical protein
MAGCAGHTQRQEWFFSVTPVKISRVHFFMAGTASCNAIAGTIRSCNQAGKAIGRFMLLTIAVTVFAASRALVQC